MRKLENQLNNSNESVELAMKSSRTPSVARNKVPSRRN